MLASPELADGFGPLIEGTCHLPPAYSVIEEIVEGFVEGFWPCLLDASEEPAEANTKQAAD